MKYSENLIKTRKNIKEEIDSKNAELLIRGAFVEQVMSGVYNYLPLGLRVVRKVENIIREEMEKIGGVEVLMPVLQPKENWQRTDRWENLDTLYRFTSHYSKTELVLGPTHEEIVVPLAKNFIFSYKDLPKFLFQIQTKFRDEKRAKGGLLRAREFIMKDLYSFHRDERDLDEYFEKAKKAYMQIFGRLGLGDNTYLTYASGGSFSEFSYEYQTLSYAGEDTIYLCQNCKVAINEEIIAKQKVCPVCGKKDFSKEKAIEVGNIFKLRTKFSKAFDLNYIDEKGRENLVEMGCYGIGVGRVIGAIAEVSNDERGVIWPSTVSPYTVYLANLSDKKEVFEKTKAIYDSLQENGIEVLWDDRDESAGTKFADADLSGIPFRVILSEKTLKEGKAEIKGREHDKERLVSLRDTVKEIIGLSSEGK
jgi:prolyl-tRNA synthetase